MNSGPFMPSDTPDIYHVHEPVSADDIVHMALRVAEMRLQRGEVLKSPRDAKQYLQLKLHSHEHEVFGVIFLDSQHAILGFEMLFRGTIDSASVYPREIVKTALAHNAAAVILFHNHPSGNSEPSESDKRLTTRIVDALALVDVRVLDHMVVSACEVVSFAEQGLL